MPQTDTAALAAPEPHACSSGLSVSAGPKAPAVLSPAVLFFIGAGAWAVVAAINLAHGASAHFPRLDLLLKAPTVLQIHVAAAVAALCVGGALMAGIKGTAFHKMAGWIWVAAMATVALSSFFILDHGRFSYIHLLSGWVSISLPMAVAAVRRRDVRRHRSLMTNMFMGGLVVAGAFTFVPGRLLWRVFFT